MSILRSSLIAVLAVLWVGAPGAKAQGSVDIALVLAADVSRSVTTDEFQLQRQGYASAIASGDVVKAILAGAHGAIALTFIEF